MSRHVYRCPLRWGDMDAQGHLNNGAYLDYLQEARVHFLLTGAEPLGAMLGTGVLVVSHQVEYLRPVVFSDRPLTVELWVDAVGGSRFAIGYDLRDGDDLAARARTGAVPYDLARNALRRLAPDERAALTAQVAPAEPMREVAGSPWRGGGHRFPLAVRWSDLDSYGHVNNVKFYDYVQEARVAVMTRTLDWSAGVVWSIVRQDVDYVLPLDFRDEPYEVATSVVAIGTRSFTLAAEVRDPAWGTVYARARTVAVGPTPLSEAERRALAHWALPDAPGQSTVRS